MLLVHQNTGKENRRGKNFFATLISSLGRFNRANKKKSVIYTLSNSLSTEGMFSYVCQKDDGHGAGRVVALSFPLFREWGSENRDFFSSKTFIIRTLLAKVAVKSRCMFGSWTLVRRIFFLCKQKPIFLEPLRNFLKKFVWHGIFLSFLTISSL